MDLYRETILDHYKNPRNFGHLTGAHVVSEEVNVSCGDRIAIEIKLKVNSQKSRLIGGSPNEATTVIEAIRFNGEGCAINQASASMLTEKVKGMVIEAVMKLNIEDVEALLGTTLTPSRIKCALLPLEAIQKAIQSMR